jgi:uncharacterized membrane protein SpoIIM required for sporulation
MIIELNKFIREKRRYWAELDALLDRLENDPGYTMDIDGVKRFHYLYQKSSADLARIISFSAEQEIRQYLESLVARAFTEIHETRRKARGFAPLRFCFRTFPDTFRRHIGAFWLALAIFIAGGLFGALAIGYDRDAKDVLMPFEHLQQDPADRVAKEESRRSQRHAEGQSSFSTFLMTHNTKVSIFAMGLGMTWGIGTVILLFTNGVMLGAVAADYTLAGQAKFLAGWLLPHGSIEIPAILLASQAGLILAGALIGWGRPVPLGTRLREVSADLVTLIVGVGLMLIWAGLVEAFLSQTHEPVIPYEFKIVFGLVEMVLLVLFLARSGKQPTAVAHERPAAATNR